LHAGTAANTVPDTAVIGINVRSRSPSLLQQALVSIECLVSDFCCKVPGCYQFHLNTSRSPKDLDGPTEGLLNLYRESGHELGVKTTWRATGGVCDGNTLAAVGLPTLDTLGVVGDNLHTENEYLTISKLLQKAQHNALFVNTICQNWLSKGD
ncbi:MAG: hypothetical protein KDK40_05750, partial [Chlamydiia bacterium]|nr:hypothetical protein [Chlamydiia bacterium]